MNIKHIEVYLDGGSFGVWIENKCYIEDHRIGTSTEGAIFIGHPNEAGSIQIEDPVIIAAVQCAVQGFKLGLIFHKPKKLLRLEDFRPDDRHAFYQDKIPREEGKCDYSYPNGNYCGLSLKSH